MAGHVEVLREMGSLPLFEEALVTEELLGQLKREMAAYWAVKPVIRVVNNPMVQYLVDDSDSPPLSQRDDSAGAEVGRR